MVSTPSMMSAASHFSRDFDFEELDGLNVDRVLDDLDQREKVMMKEALQKGQLQKGKASSKKKVTFKSKPPNPERPIQHEQNHAEEIVTTVTSMLMGIRRKLSLSSSMQKTQK